MYVLQRRHQQITLAKVLTATNVEFFRLAQSLANEVHYYQPVIRCASVKHHSVFVGNLISFRIASALLANLVMMRTGRWKCG
jgi:hypothetical protein